MEKNTPDYFGAILARVRKTQNLSLKDLAELLGKDEDGKYYITPSYLNRLEKGEKENPSFKIVCLMIEKICLNPLEVFKSFGYEGILTKGYKKESDSIKDIIRTSDIIAPLNEKGDLRSYLTQEEKECLIGVINEVLNYTVCSDDEVYHMDQVIGEVYHFRSVRQKYFERKINLNGEDITLYFSREIKNDMDSIGINDEEAYNSVSRLGSKLLQKSGKFSIIDKEKGVIIVLERIEKRPISG